MGFGITLICLHFGGKVLSLNFHLCKTNHILRIKISEILHVQCGSRYLKVLPPCLNIWSRCMYICISWQKQERIL